MQNKLIQSSKNYHVPLELFKNAKSNKVLVLLPGMGIPARFYRKFARELCHRGLSVVLFEQRGHGQSSLVASKENNWGYEEYLNQDIEATLNFVDSEFPNCNIILGGHSMGGHMSICYAAKNPKRIRSLLIIGTGSPWKENYKTLIQWFLKYIDFATSLSIKYLGYFRGDRLGFGGKEAKQFILDWKNLVKNNTYKSNKFDYEDVIKKYDGEVNVITMDADYYAPIKSVKSVTNKLESAKLNFKQVQSTPGVLKADHFNWAREPSKTVDVVLEMIDTNNL